MRHALVIALLTTVFTTSHSVAAFSASPRLRMSSVGSLAAAESRRGGTLATFSSHGSISKHGLDVLTALEAGTTGETDEQQSAFAAAQGRATYTITPRFLGSRLRAFPQACNIDRLP